MLFRSGKGKKNNKKGDGEASQLRNRSPNWSVEQTTLMLNLVREEQVSLRVQGPGTFTKQFWNRLAPIINSQSEPFRNASELQIRWKTLKAEFYDYKNCADKSGWGWDPERRVPVAPDESCWDDLRKVQNLFYV